MASIIIASACPTTFSSSFTTSSSSLPSSSAKPSQLLGNAKRNQRFKVSCKAKAAPGGGGGGDRQSAETNSLGKLDRRNMLLGLGGLYGTANMVSDRLAFADEIGTGLPVPYPKVADCGTAYINYNAANPSANIEVPYNCCPPVPSAEVKKYVFPKTDVLRIRPAAHLVDDVYIEKYIRAIQAMKNLPETDPISFYQIANIHCAYCNYGYPTGVKDEDGNDILYQVHGSWFFLPFHRWYLYFLEKIAGTLIDDPTFALPYWNWDTPCGMTMPYMFVPETSPVNPFIPNSAYDPLRNQANQPPSVLDLASSPAGTPDIQKICNNLAVMYRQLVTNAYDAEAFLGKPYYYGSQPSPGAGAIESSPHNAVHGWTGRPRNSDPENLSYGEDMGNFYSAGKDPIFYAHHANVDRMWRIWQNLGGKNFTNTAWLNSQFFFWDEKRNPVYVTIEDCLSEEKMGYTYQPMELPWLKAKPMPKMTKTDVVNNTKAQRAAHVFPAKLDKVVKVLIQRPKKSRSKAQKKKKQEKLVIEGIEYPMDEAVRFDVFINDEDEKGDILSKAEFAGTFVTVPHGGGHHHANGHEATTSMTIGLNEILEDLDADDDEFILVTLIPKSSGDKVTIDNIKIDFN